MSQNQIALTDDDLKEIFSLFTSTTRYEREQIYDKNSGHYFLDVELNEEHSLTEEKREYALDAWRAVTYFLHSRGYALRHEGHTIDLAFSEEEFLP